MRGGRPEFCTKTLTLKSPPKAREVYYIGTFEDSLEPEFTGYHPGVVLRSVGSLNDTNACVTFVPITSKQPRTNAKGELPPRIYPLLKNPNPVDDKQVWAVCDHIMTVRLSRLEYYHGRIVKVTQQDFNGILQAILDGTPSLRSYTETTTKNAVLLAHKEAELRLAEIEACRAEEIKKIEEDILDRLTSP